MHIKKCNTPINKISLNQSSLNAADPDPLRNKTIINTKTREIAINKLANNSIKNFLIIFYLTVTSILYLSFIVIINSSIIL